MAPTLQQCPVCFNHYRSTPDGKLCRHGGKPGLPTRSSAASVSGDPLGLDYSGVFDKLTTVLKCVPVYDHIPKPCREKFAHDLNALLTAEPSGISAHDGRRPDGCTLIPWRAGRCLAWDVTVPGTLAERYVNLTSKECGLAAARAADEKMKKYGNALPSMEFLPICIEVLGPMDPNTLKFLKEICKMISVRSGDSRELFFATNHISCLLQRFLRVCVLENIQLNADMCN
ncbi:hypothetical protein HELRODRAFT_171022 [Helobdella robusta]|uniref:Uncharacterized protein n=1 Tax=Helobdella robusta TaxID=6412 RepID=T1F3Q1_HELRO|nr:hypothetical protein HELRODRAFT_171022 [Helobdella robusta]ESO06986.1 hypothetical protein HELRODRAFT_171022 [Helobdella robusta]